MSAIQPLFAAFLFAQGLPLDDSGTARARALSHKRKTLLLLDFQRFLRAAREWALDAVVFGAYRNREGDAVLSCDDADVAACWMHAHAICGAG